MNTRYEDVIIHLSFYICGSYLEIKVFRLVLILVSRWMVVIYWVNQG